MNLNHPLIYYKRSYSYEKFTKIALGAWAWGNDGTFGNDFTADTLLGKGDEINENKNFCLIVIGIIASFADRL